MKKNFFAKDILKYIQKLIIQTFGLLLNKKHYYKSMKKLIYLIVILSFLNLAVLAEEDLWGNFNTDLGNPPTNQEQRYVSDEEFEQALNKMNSKVNKWKNILLNKRPMKGQEYSQGNESEALSNNRGEDSSLPIISIPADIKIGDGVIPVGHYQVDGENKDGKIILNLYQAHQLIAKIPATETQDDYDQEEILFANWIAENDDQIKIIYGSLDFNAYAIVNLNSQNENDDTLQ